MEDKKDAELKIETIIAKFIRKLKLIEKDPSILDYNFYSDKSFMGVKIMRNKKMTLDELAAIVIEGFASTNKRLDRLEDFAVNQMAYNKKIDRIEKLVELMAETPTMKKELKELENKK